MPVSGDFFFFPNVPMNLSHVKYDKRKGGKKERINGPETAKSLMDR